ncbi:hypothetical protein [Stieleria varia]|uniref:Competence protein A n=1 Tax=Stieleria varia TaxID=2528005 RepID=A0A5C6B973_9BACT|nr:hypothetical protein [Stieleria varia]TWU08192.1 hypothetical protein Pla52n_07740 [Stieleria varia]
MTTKSERSLNNAVGVLFGRRHLHGCRATRTAFGRVRHRNAIVDVIDNDVHGALLRLLAELGVADTPTSILGAIPTAECYFATRPIASGAATASPRVLLRESLRSSSSHLDEMAIDVIHWQADRRPLVGIVAVPKQRVEEIRDAVAQTIHSLQRLEPAARSLIGVASEHEGRERRGVSITRVFMGENSLLAVISRGSRPVHWQSMPLPAGDEGTGVISIARSVEAAYKACGLDRPPETVVIHGRPELKKLIDRQWLDDNLPPDYRWVDTPSMIGHDVARCLVESYLAGQDDEFDFIRQHRDPLKFSRVLPYKEICAYITAACILAGVLWIRLGDVQNEQVFLLSTAPSQVHDSTNPNSQRDQLNARATSVSQFLDKRVLWSEMLSDVTAALPDGTRLTSIHGTNAMTQKRKKAIKTAPTTLILNAECALNDDGALPESLQSLAESVQSIQSVAKYFDSVELTDLRRTTSPATGVSGAEFAVVLTQQNKGR